MLALDGIDGIEDRGMDDGHHPHLNRHGRAGDLGRGDGRLVPVGHGVGVRTGCCPKEDRCSEVERRSYRGSRYHGLLLHPWARREAFMDPD
jgi:hypothetical protein